MRWGLRCVWPGILSALISLAAQVQAASLVKEHPTTYCNPMNLDYAYAPNNTVHTYTKNNAHRSTADPVCVMYKNKYFLFSTNQEGYWCSDDLLDWKFIPHNFKMNSSGDQVCAPAAWPTDRGLLFLPCFNDKDTMPLYQSTDPESNKWTEANSAFPIPTWDPTLFQDDDGKVYIYWGSSNTLPIYGIELDPDNNYKPKGTRAELLKLHPKEHGWEQFGEDNQNTTAVEPYVEGAWMNKHNGKYYLQYGAPGTEWNVYGDGVYVSDKPLGPFTYQQHNPFSWKPTGFIRGAGHGSTFVDRNDNTWHVATMVVGIHHKFERRLGLFPAGWDEDGIMFADTAFGDYPHVMPLSKSDPHSEFSGWSLLSYHKNAQSSEPSSDAKLAFDEDVKTFWTAGNGKPGSFISVDLGSPVDVKAIQINYVDDKADQYGKQADAHHRYKIYESANGKQWNLLVDKSKNLQEVPHEYLELKQPLRTQYIKLVNVEMPSGNFAIGDLRVFGNKPGALPAAVSDFAAARDCNDKRNVSLSWSNVPSAYAYNVSFGIARDKLYSSFLCLRQQSLQLAFTEFGNTLLLSDTSS